VGFLSSYEYFDNLFENLVAIHEQLDTATVNQKEQLIAELKDIKSEGDNIYKQWMVLHEYIDILDKEYNLSGNVNINNIDTNINNESIDSIDDQKASMIVENESSNTKQVFWVADEESVATFRKGLGYFELLMYQNSVQYFQETVEKDPNFMMARVYLGLCYLSLGKLSEAEAELKKTILLSEQDSPYIALSNHALGCIYAQLEKYEIAQKYFEEVVRLNPNFKNIYFNLGAAYYNQRKYAEAIEVFAKGIQKNSDDWEMYYLIGKSSSFLMDFENALKYNKKAFQLSNKLEVGLTIGKTYELMNRIDKAKDIYDQLKISHPNESELFHRYSWLHIYNDNYRQAILLVKKAISLNPKNLTYIFTLAWIYIHSKEYQLAKKCLDIIKNANKYSILLSLGQAKIYLSNEQYKQAKEELLLAIKLHQSKTDLGILAFHLGYYWLKCKQYNKALSCFKASLRYTPHLTESNYYIKVLDKLINKKIFQPIV